MNELKEVLASIKNTSLLKQKLYKEAGLGKTDSSAILPEDMYHYEYQKPEFETRKWMILHGKCIGAGQKVLADEGYLFQQIGHNSKTDKTKAGVKCIYCGEQLDAKERERFTKEHNIKLDTRLQEYQEERELREEWEAEQILLGKM